MDSGAQAEVNKISHNAPATPSNPWGGLTRVNASESSPTAVVGGSAVGRASRAPGSGRGDSFNAAVGNVGAAAIGAERGSQPDWLAQSTASRQQYLGSTLASAAERRNGNLSSLDTATLPPGSNKANMQESPVSLSYSQFPQSAVVNQLSPQQLGGLGSASQSQQSRSFSTGAVGSIGSERRAVNASIPDGTSSVRSSRPPSPAMSASIQSLQSSILPSTTTQLPAFPQNPKLHSNEAEPSNNLSSIPQVVSQSSNNELESAFDAMLRSSVLFQEMLGRVAILEGHVHTLLMHALPANLSSQSQPNGIPSNGSFLPAPGMTAQFDGLPARSPSVVSSSANLFLPNTPGARNHNHFASSQSGQITNIQHSMTEPSTPTTDKDVIRQLSVQLSALGNNVAQLMSQQSALGTGLPGSTAGQTNTTAVVNGSWPYESPNHTQPQQHHGHGLPPHLIGRPNLSGHRAASYEVSRNNMHPRGLSASTAAYGEERDIGRGVGPGASKRGPHHLHAPTPMGMGSRRHSADVVDNMHAAAEGPAGQIAAGGVAGHGNQSLIGKWETLGVSGDLLRAIVKYGIGPPSKIQMKAIPCVLSSQDIVAQASAIQERIQCYVIPALQHVYNNIAQSALHKLSESAELPAQPAKGVQVLILTATIDQAGQAHRMCLGLGQSLGISSVLVVGQGDASNELNSLTTKPPHVLVGTPQKLLDLLSVRTIPIDRLSLFIIDEMDQLIARNLSEYVNSMAKLLPPPSSGSGDVGSRERSPTASVSNGYKSFRAGDALSSSSSPTRLAGHERQTAIFSCTVPQEVLTFASALNLREPVRVLVRRENNQDNSGTSTPATSLRGMKHYFLYLAMGGGHPGARTPGGRQDMSMATRDWKLEALADLCSDADFTQAVVYCSTMDAVEAVSYKLASRSVDALALHGDMSHSARHAIVSKFRSGSTSNRGGLKRVLVVIDSLSRTLSDIHQVALVINYDLPRIADDYIHRVACAAASGYSRAGTAINIVSSSADIDVLRSIESFYRLKINELPPTLQNVAW